MTVVFRSFGQSSKTNLKFWRSQAVHAAFLAIIRSDRGKWWRLFEKENERQTSRILRLSRAFYLKKKANFNIWFSQKFVSTCVFRFSRIFFLQDAHWSRFKGSSGNHRISWPHYLSAKRSLLIVNLENTGEQSHMISFKNAGKCLWLNFFAVSVHTHTGQERRFFVVFHRTQQISINFLLIATH